MNDTYGDGTKNIDMLLNNSQNGTQHNYTLHGEFSVTALSILLYDIQNDDIQHNQTQPAIT